jgi:UDP-N-acetyl-D-galactosamine dehydrogenase
MPVDQSKAVIAVVGLGYVGLSLAISFQGKCQVIGYDCSDERINSLKQQHDFYAEISQSALTEEHIYLTSNPEHLEKASIYFLAAPTPLDDLGKTDLTALKSMCKTVGANLAKKDLVVIESTVTPGTCEEVCLPILEAESKLTADDFYFAYSPERVNPGDKEHSLHNTKKIVSGLNAASLAKVDEIYSELLEVSTFKASSIQVAEAAKLVENIQRDTNIALMNELTQIFHGLGINTQDVIAAAGSKWNFAHFTPGLVGGHCIPIDPVYLIELAKEHGEPTQLLDTARKVNDGMADFVFRAIKKALDKLDGRKILILGLSYKPDCSDIRNSMVLDIVKLLTAAGAKVLIHDPVVDNYWLQGKTDFQVVTSANELSEITAALLAVKHKEFTEEYLKNYFSHLTPEGSLFDLSGKLQADEYSNYNFWQL